MKKTSVQSNINLETLAGGAFAEKLNEALMQVAENIQNPNTEATTKRQIQITLKFAPNKTRQLVSTQIAVTMLASNIVNTQEATFSDNGTTQQAVMKTGITTKDNVLVPNPVNLIPYRTFLEVEQPASDFVFRVSEGRGGAPVFKLVAADGGVWKSQAVANVKAYLTEALKDIPDRDKITIIA